MKALYRIGILSTVVLVLAAVALPAPKHDADGGPGSGPWRWSVSPTSPAAGTDITILVDSCPDTGPPVTVTMKIGGNVVSSGTVTGVPGSTSLSVPAGTTGQTLEIIVTVPGSYDKHTTTIL